MNKNAYRRRKNKFRIRLGINSLLKKPILNLLWIIIIPVIILFEYLKKIYISNLNIPNSLSSLMVFADQILTILVPAVIILSIMYLIGKLIAERDEDAITLAFDDKDLKKRQSNTDLKNKIT